MLVIYGRKSDSGVINNSSFGEALSKNVLNIPETDNLPETTAQWNYCFNETFPLKENLQRPFPGKILREEYRIYNYRLSRAMHVVQNAFGILAVRWRFLRPPINAHPEKATKFILAAVSLHNWLKRHDTAQKDFGRRYCSQGYVDYEDSHGILHKGVWRLELEQLSNIFTVYQKNEVKQLHTKAETTRKLFVDYFTSPQGELPWQYEYVRRTSY